MKRPGRPSPRGLTIVELMLAMTVTVFVAGAIAGMMFAVSTGVESKRDARSVMVQAHVAQSRLAAYLIPANCVLDLDDHLLTIWFRDSRESGTVHGTEIRWLVFDPVEGVIEVKFVTFPPSWNEIDVALADLEHRANSNWNAVLDHYDDGGHINTIRLVDGLTDAAMSTGAAPLDSRLVTFDLAFATDLGARTVRATPSIRLHQAPDF